MVPYGQAAHSPDRERHVTFKSQVAYWFWWTAKLEKGGDLRSKPLARHPMGRLRILETSENKSRLRTRETGENRLPLFFHDTLTVKGM